MVSPLSIKLFLWVPTFCGIRGILSTLPFYFCTRWGEGPGNVNYAYNVGKVIYSHGFNNGTTLDVRATSSASVIPDACYPDKNDSSPLFGFQKIVHLSIVVTSTLGSSSMAFMIQELK